MDYKKQLDAISKDSTRWYSEIIKEHKPTLELANEYEEMMDWYCDYCECDQVYVGNGRIACVTKDCKNVLGKELGYYIMNDDSSYVEMTLGKRIEYWVLEEHIQGYDDRLLNILLKEDREKLSNELIDRYVENWENTTTSSLIEELEILYRSGVKGFDNMDYNGILKEYEANE